MLSTDDKESTRGHGDPRSAGQSFTRKPDSLFSEHSLHGAGRARDSTGGDGLPVQGTIGSGTFAYENGRLARSIVEGRGFSSPLFEDTGPTAWMTPLYPYLTAGVFKVFGTYSTASALVLLSMQSLISALNCLPIFYFALKLFGRRAALWSGWAWAFFPYAVYFPAERIWSTWLSTALFSLLFLWTLYLEQSPRLSCWIGVGLLWGLTALTDPIVLAAWPFMNGWACFRLHQRKLRWATPLAASALAMVLIVSPWFVRNYEIFGKFIPFRDNAGLEIHIGNNGDSFHWRPRWVGPWHNDEEWQAFKELGEIRYMEREKQRGVQFIRTHPRWFAIVTVRRFVYIWTGFWSFDKRYLAEEPLDPPNVFFCTTLTLLMLLGLRRLWRENRSVTVLFAMVLFFFPAIYYVTHVEVYFRRQIDPLILVLAVYGALPRTNGSYDSALNRELPADPV
jgi:4-amino-4-deoxy-L-arabinose transferase-like glycosyltransferase